MKKLILSVAILATITFAACKKDNLQPTANNSTTIEQESNEDKATDLRNYFVGFYTKTVAAYTDANGDSYPEIEYTINVTKSGTSKLKVVVKSWVATSTSPKENRTWIASKTAGKLEYKATSSSSLGICFRTDHIKLYKSTKTSKLNLVNTQTVCSSSSVKKLLNLKKQ